MERSEHAMNHTAVTPLSLILLSTVCHAQPTERPVILDVTDGEQAKKMQVIPAWTMRKCPKEFYATYNLEEAKELKMRDNDCQFWKTSRKAFSNLYNEQKKLINSLDKRIEIFEVQQNLSKKRIDELLKQLHKEIEAKNEFKYKPDYKWIYIAVGAAVAAIGISFGVGAAVMR